MEDNIKSITIRFSADNKDFEMDIKRFTEDTVTLKKNEIEDKNLTNCVDYLVNTL